MVFGSSPTPIKSEKIKNKKNVVKVVQNLLDPRMIMVLKINSVGSGVPVQSHTGCIDRSNTEQILQMNLAIRHKSSS